ncbi:hypothetical protein NPIL_679721 [Nephila pilipes]|uniref:Uncharacterized protein n=1 Tax=Nephila pilipes TaxID=299642 RepID=A0A8X6PKX4_NEPPI|nr:hypothetical protein NPIL_679721 [Nephila pilipes]
MNTEEKGKRILRNLNILPGNYFRFFSDRRSHYGSIKYEALALVEVRSKVVSKRCYLGIRERYYLSANLRLFVWQLTSSFWQLVSSAYNEVKISSGVSLPRVSSQP